MRHVATSAFRAVVLLLVALVPPLEAALPELPRVPEIVRFNCHLMAKRIYGKAIAGGFRPGRAFVAGVRAAAAALLDPPGLAGPRTPATAGFAWLGQREIEAPDFSAGKNRSVALPKENVVAGVTSRLDYDFSVAGGTGAGAVLADAAHRTHDVVHVERKGNAIHHVLGQTLGKIQKLLGEEELPQTDPSDDAAGQDDDDRIARVFIPFAPPRAYRSEAFALSTRRQSPVNVHIKGGSAQSLLTRDADGVAAFDAAELLFIEHAMKSVQEDPPNKWGIWSLRHIAKTFSADQTLRIPLEHLIPGTALARIWIEVQNEGSSDDQYQYADDVVNRLRFRMNGVDQVEDTAFDDYQARNKSIYGLASVETGVVCVDFMEDRQLEPGMIPIVGQGEVPTLYLDVDYTAGSNEHRTVITTETLLYPSGWRRS